MSATIISSGYLLGRLFHLWFFHFPHRGAIGMSALPPPKADMGSAQVHVRFGPIADIESAARSTYGF
jgi:hypothetical protein